MSQLAAPARTARPARTRVSRPVRTARTAPSSARVASLRQGSGSSRVAAVSHEREHSRAFMVTVFVVAFASAIALLLLNTLRSEQSFTVSRLQSDVTTLGDREQALDSELSAVSAPEALAMKANDYGMVPAKSVIYRSSKTGKQLGVAGSPLSGAGLNVNTLPNTPATRVAAGVLSSGTIGVHITDPVAQAQKAAQKKAADDAKRAADDAKRAADAAKAHQSSDATAGKSAAQTEKKK